MTINLLFSANAHSKILSVTPDNEAPDLQIIGLKVRLNDSEAYSFPIKTRCNSADARTISTNPVGVSRFYHLSPNYKVVLFSKEL